MEIIWSDQAYKKWKETADYILHQYGVDAVIRFKTNINEWEDSLSQLPLIGQLEPLLRHRQIPYRSVVINKLNKLIYYLDNDKIIIADLWDTRKEPKAQANITK